MEVILTFDVFVTGDTDVAQVCSNSRLQEVTDATHGGGGPTTPQYL